MDVEKLRKRLQTELNYWNKRKKGNDDCMDSQYFNATARHNLEVDNKLCTRHINNVQKAIDLIFGY